MTGFSRSSYPPYLSVTLLSASALAYEVLLMRLFSIIQWHHFAYMIIGLALLGYSISGTIISIFKRQLIKHYYIYYLLSIFLFSLTTIGCYMLAQEIPFNAEEILWDTTQVFYLGAMFLILTLPFFLAATAICLSFIKYGTKVPRIYAADLLGAGIGSLSILFLLYWVFPQWALILIGIGGLIAVILAVYELSYPYPKIIGINTLLLIGLLIYSGPSLELNMSPYKGLMQTLRISGAEVIEEHSSPLGYLSVVRSEQFPFRYAPGLSVKARYEPLPQIGMFVDGDNLSVMTRYPSTLDKLQYLDEMTSAAPYHLKQIHEVLIIGAGGGADVLQAKFHQVDNIEAIELNPQIVDLLKTTYADFTGHLYQQNDVTIHVTEARSFLSDTLLKYDLLQLALIDAFNASSSGLYALNESYFYTVEALRQYLDHLKPDGYLAITRWIKLPPRDSLKLVATAIRALEEKGVTAPYKQLVLLRSWQTSTLLVKNGEFSELELATLQQFCEVRAFDLAYTSTLSREQVNRFNVLSEPVFYEAISAMFSDEREQFLARYKFDLQPATDDRPYFHHFFKWATFDEIYQLRRQGGMPLIEWGYIILVATLCIAILLSIVLIILPLWFFHRAQLSIPNGIKRSAVLYYFFAIGLAFLFIEIAFIQKFTLFLHHPITTIAVVLTAFLVFAGAGSLLSGHLVQRYNSRTIINYAVWGITILCVSYLLLLGPLFTSLTAIAQPLKIIIAIALIAPLAICMGMPFPMGLAILGGQTNHYVPWAWGINGCASVISAVLATLLAIHFGFSMVVLCAVILYLTLILTHLTATS
ncbi:spermine/spermidine synthase domain-containing protein [Kaarinaea lacus]